MMMQHEFAQAVCISLTAYLVGIYTYEHAATYKDRWLGRIAILMSVVVLIAFGHYAVEQCAVTQDELAAMKNRADSIYQVAKITDYNVTLSSGTKVQWSTIDDRRSGPMSVVQGRSSGERHSSVGSTAITSRQSAGSNELRNGTLWRNGSSWNADESTGKAF